MDMPIEEKLLQVIKEDDLKAFDSLNATAPCLDFCLGRFPVLSLLYLYKARRILAEYEDSMLRITVYKELREPIEISEKFSKKAGKCLRLYLKETVSPLEMLLILDKTKRLKRVFPMVYSSSAVRARLKSIYSIKYALSVKYEGDGIVIDRRPLSRREKKNAATLCLCIILAVVIIVGVPVTTVSLLPNPVEGEASTFGQIDFASAKEYKLTQDIIVPENFSVQKVNCKINGGGHKITVGKGARFTDFNGEFSNLTLVTQGDVIFTTISETAVLKDVTVNVNADISGSVSSAFVALTNYGTVDNVTVNVKGSISARADQTGTSEELIFGAIVKNNSYKLNAATQTAYSGIIKDCKVNYTDFKLFGEASANASFGGLAGINGGYVQDCTISGEIIADTFDVAGICSENNGYLLRSVNEAALLQTSSDEDWNPVTCGIVLTNAGAVESCENRANISSASDCAQFDVEEGHEVASSASGIAYLNRGTSSTPYIKNCVNKGEVQSSAHFRSVYAAGICLSSSGLIETCRNEGEISAQSANDAGVYVGGITAIANGNVVKSVNSGAVTAVSKGAAYVGGIAARSISQIVYCVSSGNVSVDAREVFAGGILGTSEIATREGIITLVYFGTAKFCISECKLNINSSAGKGFVGGIIGGVTEMGFKNENGVVYYGGGVTDSCFAGEITGDAPYSGGVAGVCGANIYETNSYSSGTETFKNFDNNLYAYSKAFGAAAKADGSFVGVTDKGAAALGADDIRGSDLYKSISDALEESDEE